MTARAIKLCGTEAVDAPSRALRAGALSVELENGQLRYVRLGGVEVLRGVAFLVRDENWGTYAPQISNLAVQETNAGFEVAYRAVCADARQRLSYEARIVGGADGLVFSATATPETDFVTNRAGFVLLHPAFLAGAALKVAHTDGAEETTRFPATISPSQPVFDIRALTHEVAPGLRATCRMEGDAFEMEDQRNWTDASYKTYVRPLALPWGYTLEKGSRHEQSVRLSFEGRAAASGAQGEAATAIALGLATGGRLPEIGVALPADLAPAAIEPLRRLKPGYLIASVDPGEAGALARLGQVAEGVPARLALEIVVPDDSDAVAALAPVAAAARGLQLESVIVSSASDLKSWQPGAKRPEQPTNDEIAKAARAAFPGVRLGGGMLSTFTELNRKRPNAALYDFISHTTCSIVHAADDRSVMETLETLPAIIASTRAMIGETPCRIGPSAIAARSNPYGKNVLDNPNNQRLCLTDRDPRQRGLFNAAWTIGYVAACAYGGLEAVALGAATGPLGLIDDDGRLHPAFHAIAGVARGAGLPLVEARSSAPGKIAALAWRNGGRVTLWLANLTPEPAPVRLPSEAVSASVLDAAAFDQAAQSPDAIDQLRRPLSAPELTLDAYAIARIEIERN